MLGRRGFKFHAILEIERLEILQFVTTINYKDINNKHTQLLSTRQVNSASDIVF
jgi:hypothetical protein